MILKPGEADTSKLHLEKLQYVDNVCINFRNDPSKAVGGVHNIKLLEFDACIESKH